MNYETLKAQKIMSLVGGNAAEAAAYSTPNVSQPFCFA